VSYWLLKTEPRDYSYLELLREGITRWSGVSNSLALQHLRNMEVGDQLLIYHSGKEKAIVGIAEVTVSPYPDPERNNPALVVVDIKAVRQLPRPVPLGSIRARKEFLAHPLVRMPRLSVVPMSEADWKFILSLSSIH
jgi:predicted RNA-binding protein with PUA-like domain